METTKYKGITITNTPTEKFPNLVTFTKTVKKAQSELNKKFLDLEKAKEYIDNLELHLWELKTQMRIQKNEARIAKKELLKLNGMQMLKSGEA